jgi:HEAT repeat protein
LGDDAAPVRRAAAWALGELELKKSIPALIHVLARDQDASVRQAAAWAIGSIR